MVAQASSIHARKIPIDYNTRYTSYVLAMWKSQTRMSQCHVSNYKWDNQSIIMT